MVVGAGDIPRLLSQVRRATRTQSPKIQVSITTVFSQFLYLAHVLRLQVREADTPDVAAEEG